MALEETTAAHLAGYVPALDEVQAPDPQLAARMLVQTWKPSPIGW